MPQTRNLTEQGDRCVATQQKAVYKWYESRHSDNEVVDIYSPQWHARLTAWYTWWRDHSGAKAEQQLPADTVKSWTTPEEIDLRVFFFVHAVAAFALWHVLRAFYGLDDAVCGPSPDGGGGNDAAPAVLARWRDMKPFVYLKSKAVRRRWEVELRRLNKEIECGALAGERLKWRMHYILAGVEQLERALAFLEQDLDVEHDEVELAEEILTTIRAVVDARCNLIVKLLKVGQVDYILNSAEDGPYDESLLPSSANSPDASNTQLLRLSERRSWSFPPPMRRDSFNFLTNDIMFSLFILVVLGLVTLSGVKTLDFVSRNYA